MASATTDDLSINIGESDDAQRVQRCYDVFANARRIQRRGLWNLNGGNELHFGFAKLTDVGTQ